MRWSLTDEQFMAYHKAERKAEAGEVHLNAVGTAHAIAHVLAKGDSLRKFGRTLHRTMGGEDALSDTMAEMKKRIKQVVDIPQTVGSRY